VERCGRSGCFRVRGAAACPFFSVVEGASVPLLAKMAQTKKPAVG
jgi:hypothetical protein